MPSSTQSARARVEASRTSGKKTKIVIIGVLIEIPPVVCDWWRGRRPGGRRGKTWVRDRRRSGAGRKWSVMDNSIIIAFSYPQS
jgi:hypothetical protein